MHIVCIHQHFTTPKGITIIRSYEFAKRWIAKGHKVTVIASTAQLTKDDLSAARGSFFKKFTADGINVIAMAIPYRQQMGVLKRCLSFAVFSLLCSIAILFIRKFDVVYAISTPLTTGIPAIAAKWFKRKNFVFEVCDQWPASVVELGVISNKFVIAILAWLEKFIYKKSSVIVAVSDGMAESIRKIAGPDKPIYVVPNSADLDLFRPDIDGSQIRKNRNWDKKFVFLHAGAMGKTNSLNFVIDAASRLKQYRDIMFVLIGEGSQKPALSGRIKELNLTTVEIISAVPRTQLPPYLAAADVIMCIIGNFPIIEQHASLNKFYDGLAAGKPIILNYDGWQGQALKEKNAGLGSKLCNLDEFVQNILYLYNNRNLLPQMGKNSRSFAQEKFDRDMLAQIALDAISKAAKND